MCVYINIYTHTGTHNEFFVHLCIYIHDHRYSFVKPVNKYLVTSSKLFKMSVFSEYTPLLSRTDVKKINQIKTLNVEKFFANSIGECFNLHGGKREI